MVTSLVCAAVRLCTAALSESGWPYDWALAQGLRLPAGWRA